MAFQTIFYDSEFIEYTFDVHKTNCDGNDRIVITCYDDDGEINHSIWLDRKTAIKFAKTIRTEINKMSVVDLDTLSNLF